MVLDTSAVVSLLIGDATSTDLRRRIRPLSAVHVPHAIDPEIVHALRRLVLRGALSIDRASDAVAAFSRMRLIRHEHEPLVGRMWQLRDNLSAYDATYVALAEALKLPLVTCDGRIGRAPNLRTQTEIYD